VDPLLALEAYHRALPGGDAREEVLGPLVLPVPVVVARPWPARPLTAGAAVTADDVRRVTARMSELGIPPALEWVAGRPAGLEDSCREAGLAVHSHPLLCAEPGDLHPLAAVDADVRLLRREDDVARADAVARVAFRGAPSGAGVAALDAVQERDAHVVAARTAQVLEGRPLLAAAYVDDEPVARAGCTVEGPTAEVTGVATLPAYRGRGLAGAVVALLAAEAFDRGARRVFVTADDEGAARVYARVGMTRVGTAWVAGAPA
jgi:ribosomal protein S18 acetylase RimI-like enzyme